MHCNITCKILESSAQYGGFCGTEFFFSWRFKLIFLQYSVSGYACDIIGAVTPTEWQKDVSTYPQNMTSVLLLLIFNAKNILLN